MLFRSHSKILVCRPDDWLWLSIPFFRPISAHPLKPSGLIDWINCKLYNGWVHIKCANLSRTEARSLAEFKRSRCSLVNTIPQCQDDDFRPDTLFNSGIVQLKRVPKNSRIPLAENLIPKINDLCETSSNFALWCLLFSSLSCFLEKPTRGG